MSTIVYREIAEDELNLEFFSYFERHQEVRKCWRKEDGNWILKDIAFTEFWGENEYRYLVECLKNTLKEGGGVFGAFMDGKLIGFSSVENQPMGSHQDYLQLSSIHVSYGYRGQGAGFELFNMTCRKAKELGAKKLYISAHSSEETQNFYKRLGCVEALEYDEKLVALEPCDCQLEYLL